MHRDLGPGIYLEGLNEAQLEDAGPEMAPARFLIHEWRDYAIVWPGAPPGDGVHLSGVPASTYRRVGDSAQFSFQNQLGLAHIVARAGAERFEFDVEVLSPKFSTVDEHRGFYDRLVRDLHARAAALPFAVSAPTAVRTRETAAQPSDLLVWHFLREHHEAIKEALAQVLNRPRRQLTVEERVSELDRVSAVEIGSVISAAFTPGNLAPVAPSSPAYEWQVARSLTRRSDNQRFVPLTLVESYPQEILDTPEHRFVRAFATELSLAARRIAARLPADLARIPESLAGHLDEALRDTFLSEVGAMTTFPAASHVLQRAEGYRDLLSLWRLFNSAVDSFAAMQRALDVRDVATLYEWWCFFALADHLSAVLGYPGRMTSEIDDWNGLRHRLAVEFHGGWKLIYNRTFSRGSGPWSSYSMPLRPDFVLSHGGGPIIGLDAKFRFDQRGFALAGSEDEVVAAEIPHLSVVERLAKSADVYKMHTYRDALGIPCVLVVYPGTKSVFYPSDGSGPTEIVLQQILSESTPSGVGAIVLTPEETDREW